MTQRLLCGCSFLDTFGPVWKNILEKLIDEGRFLRMHAVLSQYLPSAYLLDVNFYTISMYFFAAEDESCGRGKMTGSAASVPGVSSARSRYPLKKQLRGRAFCIDAEFCDETHGSLTH